MEVQIKNGKCSVYPTIVDSLQVQDLYDSAKWHLYTWNCDVPYKPKSDSLISKPFGELELMFNNLVIKHDTLVLIFNFIDKDQAILPNMTRDNTQLVTGVGFNMKTKRKTELLFPGGSVSYQGGFNRYETALQPEVLKFIKEDWDKLDECFRNLAEKKGIRK
ncbi:hypothetical protein [Ferruginibacter profundus]